ncbi:MAG: multifunctional CCA addition/repair protein [Cellvibrionaceae bacterium]
MKTYLVGGAVRDKLLGYPFHEHDWVVVGSSPQEMLDNGFKPVGKDFPVFLHPETNEEHALARTERKTGSGYHGFQFHTDKSVTLEQDLERRDLTINAIAEDDKGNIIDPYQGQQDLKEKKLRHVSPAFSEDPVRVLRVARFAARYHHLGFSIAAETLALMTHIVNNGEMDHLTPERVWKETDSALKEQSPWVYFEALKECGALGKIFPEIERLFGVPQPEQHHPEIDTGIHTLMSLQQACALTESPEVRFAVLVHDLGKGTTPKEEWPRHIAHEARSEKLIKKLCQRLRIPNNYRDLACAVGFYHTQCHTALELKPATVLKLLNSLDAFRRPEKLQQFLLACRADAQGRTGKENVPYTQADYLLSAYQAAAAVETKPLIEKGLSGKELGEALQKERIKQITQVKNRFSA